MVTINHSQVGPDEDLAREILLVARTIAPCLPSLDGEDEKNALAVLKRIFKELAARGLQSVKGQRIGSASVEYRDIESAFAGQPTVALRSLCPSAQQSAGHSVASFPSDRVVSRVWPEGS